MVGNYFRVLGDKAVYHCKLSHQEDYIEFNYKFIIK